ncbi:MAG: MFS transporter, partial [Bacillota bacterium]|nr:MFS transporter [Bacillota bacterium]
MKGNTEYNTRINVINGIAAAAAVNLVNPFFAKFAERIGASEIEIALLSSLPAFISVFALIPGAIMIDVLGQKQRTTAAFMFLNKLFLLLIALIPFVPDHVTFKPFLFVLMIALMNFPGSIYTNGYNSSIADIFDPRERGRATALRNRFSDITRITITLLSGVIMMIPKTNSEVIMLYQIYFVVAFGLSLIEISTFRAFRFPETAPQEVDKTNKIKRSLEALKKSIAFTVKDKEYRAFLICSLLFHFGWQMGWALFTVYQIKVLHATEIWFSAINIAAALASIFTATAWMRFADRKSHTFTIIFATFGMSVTPFLYVMSTSLYELVFYNVIIGFSITGTTLLLLNIMLNRTPSENRTTIMSIYST